MARTPALNLALTLTLWGCGPGAPTTQYVVGGPAVDPRANAEVWAFEAAWGWQVTGVQLEFVGDVSRLPGAVPGSVGLCRRLSGGLRRVDVSLGWWLRHPACREALVFHELGHCVLGLRHSAEPESVMYPEVSVACAVWPTRRAELVAELFQ